MNTPCETHLMQFFTNRRNNASVLFGQAFIWIDLTNLIHISNLKQRDLKEYKHLRTISKRGWFCVPRSVCINKGVTDTIYRCCRRGDRESSVQPFATSGSRGVNLLKMRIPTNYINKSEDKALISQDMEYVIGKLQGKLIVETCKSHHNKHKHRSSPYCVPDTKICDNREVNGKKIIAKCPKCFSRNCSCVIEDRLDSVTLLKKLLKEQTLIQEAVKRLQNQELSLNCDESRIKSLSNESGIWEDNDEAVRYTAEGVRYTAEAIRYTSYESEEEPDSWVLPDNSASSKFYCFHVAFFMTIHAKFCVFHAWQCSEKHRAYLNPVSDPIALTAIHKFHHNMRSNWNVIKTGLSWYSGLVKIKILIYLGRK